MCVYLHTQGNMLFVTYKYYILVYHNSYGWTSSYRYYNIKGPPEAEEVGNDLSALKNNPH